MNHKTNHAAAGGVPAISAIVTVPGEYFVPLVEAVIDVTSWCIRKARNLVRA